MTMSQAYPKISIVTATYNSERFLEKTIQSILNQQYPNLEYIIIDGGSTDGTIDIIKQYEDQLAYWISEPDEGMYHAIQKGFDRSTGEIMAWLNSDDMYLDWTLRFVAKLFMELPEVEWLTTNQVMIIDAQDIPQLVTKSAGYSQEGYLRGEHFPGLFSDFAMNTIMQEATFWRRSLWEKAGGRLDTDYRYAGDAELWFRFFKHARLYDVSIPLARFRAHDNQITRKLRNNYHVELDDIFKKYGGIYPTALRSQLRRLARVFTPWRLRKLPSLIHLMHKCYQIRFSDRTQDWETQPDYY